MSCVWLNMKRARYSARRARLFFAATAIIAGAELGCSPTQKAALGTLARWETQLSWPKASGGRKVADAGPRCLKDRLASPRVLRDEVERLEQRIGVVAVTGEWQGKDLASFAGPQAQFLKANAYWIATEGIDFKDCKDLPCIINKVYSDKATEQGWRAYYYYLATGYSLSMRDYVPTLGVRWREDPDQAVFDAPRAAHLFSNGELYSFSKLASLLPASYQFMGSQRIHRVPDNHQVPDASWCKKGLLNADGTCKLGKSTTCGDSWGGKSKGLIRLKRCLEEDNFSKKIFYDRDDETLADNGIRGEFYVTASHELTHAWDRTQSSGLTPEGFLSVFSDTDEWKSLSGWHEETVYIPESSRTSGNTETLVSIWQPEVGRDGFIRANARRGPAEDLAETAAWVRFRPTLVAQRSPLKAEFLSNKLFGGRTYDPAGLGNFYVDAAVKKTWPQLLGVVQSCVARNQGPSVSNGSAAIAGVAHLTLEAPLPENLVACLETEIDDRVTVEFDQLRATEWEACDLFSEKEVELRSQVFRRLSQEVSRLVAEDAVNSPAIQAMLKLRATLTVQVDPREAYIHCFRHVQPEACYQQALSDAFDLSGQAFAVELRDLLSLEKTYYLAANPYLQSQARAHQFYNEVLAGIEPILTEIAQSRWQSCFNMPTPSPLPGLGSSGVDPIVSPYSGGTHYVSASLLNCINSAYEADLVTARDSFLSRHGLSVMDVDVQALIQEMLLPTYLSALKAKQNEVADAEDAKRERRMPGVLEVLSSALLRDRSWLAEYDSPDEANGPCLVAAGREFDSYFGRVSADEQLPIRFASTEDIRTDWSLRACAQVLASRSITQELKSRADKAWKSSLLVLESAVSSRARDKATDCVARNPRGSAKVSESIQMHRRECLIAKHAWNVVETQALVDWSQSLEGRGFASTRKKDALAYLGERRRALQIVVIKTMRARK